MYAIRTYIFYQSLNRLQRGLSAIAELLVMLGSHRMGAICLLKVRRLLTKLLDGCSCTVRWPVVLLKLKLVTCL